MNKSVSIMGINVNGLHGKLDSLKSNIEYFKPSIVTIQETKHKKPGKVQINGYQNFERVREDKEGGGVMILVENVLEPVLTHVGVDGNEILSVDVNVDPIGKRKLRIINGYGPQEHAGQNTINKFWQDLEEQVMLAKSCDSFCLLQLDANAKIGKEVIKLRV